MPHIAQELIDSIIDIIVADSVRDGLWPGTNLLQCSLASRSFRPRSLRHMFSSIVIREGRDEIPKMRTRKLHYIIVDQPQIAHYVKEISLESLDQATPDGPLLKDEQLLINVVKQLSRLRKLKLSASVCVLKFNPCLRNLILRLPSLAPSITSLDLRGLWGVPIEVVTSCVHLKSLGLMSSSLEMGDQLLNTNASSPSLKLEHFSCITSGEALEMLLYQYMYSDFSRLVSFTAYIGDSPPDSEQAIINLSSTLEELHLLTLDYSSTEVLQWKTLNLKASVRLRCLRVHVPFSPRFHTIQQSVNYIYKLLSTTRTGSLETLYIEAKLGFIEPSTPHHPKVLLRADWSSVCGEISRVMAGTSSTFEFKLACRYVPTRGVNPTADLKAMAQEQYQLVRAELLKDTFSSLESSGTNLVISDHARVVIEKN